MSLIEAVYIVLKEAGVPLKPDEILSRVFQKNLWETTGKTPLATLTARLYVDIKERNPSRFVKTDDGRFGLSGLGEEPKKSKPVSGKKVLPKPLNHSGHPTYSFTDCAEKVLRIQSPRRPMTYSEIIKVAIEKGWLVTVGKTPEATLGVQIAQDIKRAQERGKISRFTYVSRGCIGLTEYVGGIEAMVKKHREDICEQLHKKLMKLDPKDFEKLIMKLFAKMGFEKVSCTPYSGDGGIDVRGTMVTNGVIRTKFAIQVKRFTHNVQAPVVQQVRGSLGANEQGCIVTTSDFSQGAREEATMLDKTPISLINGEDLVNLLMRYEVGVKSKKELLFEIEEDFGLNEENGPFGFGAISML